MKKLSFLAAIVFSCLYQNLSGQIQIKESDFSMLRLQHKVEEQAVLSRISIEKVTEPFTVLSPEGYVSSHKVGMPALPQRIEFIQLPEKAELKIKIKKSRYKDFDLTALAYPNPIIPAQAPICKSGPEVEFAYKKEAYKENRYTDVPLVQVEYVGEMRGIRLAKLIISPFQYNPSQHKLRVYNDLDFEIYFEGADVEATSKKMQTYASSTFLSISKKLLNPMSLVGKTKAKIQKEVPMSYVMVSDPMFRDSLQAFIQWKRIQGFKVIEAYTSDPKVGNTSESIRNYLKELYEEADAKNPAPSYILLVGDATQIPPFKGRQLPDPDIYKESHVSDLYYAEYTGDYLPEVYYGRFSANNIQELMPQLKKNIQMQQLSMPSSTFLDTVLLVAGYDLGNGISHLNRQLNYLKEEYFSKDLDCEAKYFYHPSSLNESENILKQITNGVSLLFYSGHGVETGFAGPVIKNADLSRLNNQDKYPFVFSNCCLTGRFEIKDCFAETWLRLENKGAVGIIAASSPSYFHEDFYWTTGYSHLIENPDSNQVKVSYDNTGFSAFDALFHTHGEDYSLWARTAAEVMWSGNMEVERTNSAVKDYYWEIYHVFGDPSYQMYRKDAPLVEVEHPGFIYEGSMRFELKTEAYAQVAITLGNQIFGATQADKEGMVYLDLDPVLGADSVMLYVGNQYKAPYIKKLEVKKSEAALICFDETIIKDTEGQDINRGLYAHQYAHNFTLLNKGKNAADNIKMEIFTGDTNLKALGAYTHTTALAAESQAIVTGALSFILSPEIADQHTIEYEIHIYINEKLNFKKKMRFFVEAPIFAVSEVKIIHPENGKEGAIDPGKSMELSYVLHNKGKGLAKDVKIKFESDKPYLHFEDAEFIHQNIVSGDSSKGRVLFRADPHANLYEVYTLFFKALTKGREEVLSSKSYVSKAVENFESGDFSSVAWDAASDWQIVKSPVYEGSYAAASASIADKQKSILSIQYESQLEDTLHFYYKISSECMEEVFGDFLRFRLDGEVKGEWCGERDWSLFSLLVPKGIHTYEWEYEKDETNKEGRDKVWIDQINFPVGVKAPIVENEILNSKKHTSSMLALLANAGELTLQFNMAQESRGRVYLTNILGQRINLNADRLSLPSGESSLTIGLPNLLKTLYICTFEFENGKTISTKFITL